MDKKLLKSFRLEIHDGGMAMGMTAILKIWAQLFKANDIVS